MTMKMKHWQDPVSLLAGLWLAASPWAFAYAGDTQPAWHAVGIGAVIALISLAALFRAFAWQQWVNMLLGAWLIASPWLLGFSAVQAAMLNAVAVGALVVVLAAWALGTDRDFGGWFSTAH